MKVEEDHENKILRRNTSSNRIELLVGNCWNQNPHRLRNVSGTRLRPQKLGGFPLFSRPDPISPPTHVHQDHCGLIPKLVKDGFQGDILLTPASKELFPIVILDSARIQEEDAAFKKNRNDNEEHKEPYLETPLYTVQDAEKCFPLLKAVPYGEFLTLTEQVKVCFHDAGHILGSAMIEIVFQDENESRNIIFSGDIGQFDTPLLNNPTVFDRADYVVMESTYGDRNHDNLQDIDDKLSIIINDTIRAGGNVIIPTFAIERAQEILYHISLLAHAKRIPYIVTFLIALWL